MFNPLITLAIPFIGCLISGFSGRFFGRRGSVLINTGCLIVAVLLAWYNYLVSMHGAQSVISLSL